MVIYTADVRENLPVFEILSRLIHGFVYNHIAPYEHDGFKHSSGKVFHSTNFKFQYKKDSNKFRFLFLSLLPETEKRFYDFVKQNGLKLGSIKFNNPQLEYKTRAWLTNEIVFWSEILMTLKDQNGKKLFLEPKDPKFIENLKRYSIQKFETIFKKDYLGEFEIEVLKQSTNKTKLFYNSNPYFTWSAKYKLKADNEMINLLLNTGIGSQTMKGFGFISIEKDNFIDQENIEE